MRRSNSALDLAFKTRLNYRLDFDDLYGVIQPTVKTNFITEVEKEHIVNAIFIMIQNGISLTVKNDLNQFIHEDTNKEKEESKPQVAKKSATPFSGFFQANKRQEINKKQETSSTGQINSYQPKNQTNLLVNESGTMQREYIFKPEFEKYLVYHVSWTT